MSGVTFRMTVDAGPIAEGLGRVATLTGNLVPVLSAAGDALISGTRDRFRAGRDPTGAPWRPLSRAYADTKRGGQILVESRALMNSITRRVSGRTLEVGSNRIYARIHQEGGVIRAKGGGALRFPLGDGYVTVKSVTIPARPYLGLSAADERAVLDAVEDAIDNALGR
jgi:phage virion morphogenesis protein